MATPATYHGQARGGYSSPRRSLISCWRMGILSMTRPSSRTSQGKGLRSFTPPSLPMSTIMKPRGRSSVRRSDFAAGSVSVRTTTSRSRSASICSSSSEICSMNRGSAGLSAKTITGRFVQRKLSIGAGSVKKTGASSVTSSVDAVDPKRAAKTTAKPWRTEVLMSANIGAFDAIAMVSTCASQKFMKTRVPAQRMVI